MEELQTSFSFNARYYRSGAITEATKHLWFVLHGYGQLARYFLRKFDPLHGNDVCVIAPEGLSRFYLEPVTGIGRKNNRVGATWMTREHRETDIRNYIAYLDSIFYHEVGSRAIPTTVLGFSQGAATASRWVWQSRFAFQRLILWAGIFPPDMNFSAAANALDNKDLLFVYGTEDPFMTGDRLTEMRTLADKLNVTVKTMQFQGGHDIDSPTLERLRGV